MSKRSELAPRAGRPLARFEPGPWPSSRAEPEGFVPLGAVLRRRAGTILGASVAVMAAAALLTSIWPRTYESTATILVEPSDAPSEVPGLALLERIGRTSTLETEAELLRSRRVIEAVVDSLDLDAAIAEEPGVTPEEAFARAVGGVRKRVEVAPASREGDVLEITCAADEPGQARDLCNAVTRSYVALRATLQRSAASATADFLRDQVEEYGSRLAAAEDSLEAFARQHQLVAIGEQASEEVRNYSQVRGQRDHIEAERQALAGMLARAERAPGGDRRYRELASFPTLLQNMAVSQLLTQQAELENRRSELAERRTERDPELAALDRRIADIDRQLGQMARSYERSLASQVASLNEVVGSSSGRLSRYPERQVEMARLQRQVTSLGEITALLEANLRESEVAEAVSQPRVRIVDAASLPLEPSWPRPLLSLALAAVLGLGFGLALAVARDRLDTRIHGRSDLERRTDLPIVAMIPQVEPAGPVLPVELVRNGDEAARPLVHDGSGRSLLPALRAWPRRAGWNGPGVGADAFRSLGSDLQAIARRLGTGEIRSLAVTSAGPADGKTFVACNLALTWAGFGVHTLLIDADMRAGSVAHFFGAEPSPGLSELLSGTASARDARRTIRLGDTDALSVMPAGSPTTDAAELLQTSYFEAMLAGAQAVYDLVVLDTPPLNVLPDTAAVVGQVNAVLVVVRDEVTDGAALELTLERLERAGGPVIGIVFNDVDLPPQFIYGSEPYRHA